MTHKRTSRPKPAAKRVTARNAPSGKRLRIEGKAGVVPTGNAGAQRQFRDTLGHFCTGVTVMTSLAPGTAVQVGLTVSSFNALSLDPPLILWGLAKDAATYKSFQVGSPFAVNVLSADQESVALQFARPYRKPADRFRNLGLHHGLDGVPLIHGCVVYFECVTDARYPGGDHDIIVGRVRRIFTIGRSPLLFHVGAFKNIQL